MYSPLGRKKRLPPFKERNGIHFFRRRGEYIFRISPGGFGATSRDTLRMSCWSFVQCKTRVFSWGDIENSNVPNRLSSTFSFFKASQGTLIVPFLTLSMMKVTRALPSGPVVLTHPPSPWWSCIHCVEARAHIMCSTGEAVHQTCLVLLHIRSCRSCRWSVICLRPGLSARTGRSWCSRVVSCSPFVSGGWRFVNPGWTSTHDDNAIALFE